MLLETIMYTVHVRNKLVELNIYPYIVDHLYQATLFFHFLRNH